MAGIFFVLENMGIFVDVCVTVSRWLTFFLTEHYVFQTRYQTYENAMNKSQLEPY